MHTVIETPSFLSSAKSEGMTEAERAAAISAIAADPTGGQMIVGSGGCRKVRVAGRGKGKSGGYRVVTFFGGDTVPVFLLWVLSKGSRENFTGAEVNAMKVMTTKLVESLGARAAQ
jgi:hypothetical protein